MVERNDAENGKEKVQAAVSELERGLEAENSPESPAGGFEVKVHFNGGDYGGRALVGALIADDGIQLLIGGRVSDKEMCNALTHILSEMHKYKETVVDLAMMAFIAEEVAK